MRLTRKTLPLLILISFCALLLNAQSVTFSISPAHLHPGEKGTLKATLTIPPELEKKQSWDPIETDNNYLAFTGENSKLRFGMMKLPKADHVSDAGIWEYYGPLTLTIPFTVKPSAKAGKTTINTNMTYGLCYKTKGYCDPPTDVTGTADLEILPSANEADSLAAIAAEADTSNKPESGLTSATEKPVNKDKTTPWNILFYMLMAILGGIVLNFTPCVLPILPIRAMSMVNQAQKDITKVFLHTMVYTLGVLISFGSIAAVFIIARLSGVNLTYGFLSQSLTYNLIMLSILFLFGLSLMDVFEMTIPGMSAAARTTAKKGYAGSFFGGIFAFLMGFACMGPFMGPALEVAVRLSSPLMMIFFLLIGLGFALPFILIAMVPKALKLIPKPGEWMNIFKEVMGFLLMILAWKYVSNLWGLTKSGDYLLHALHYLVFLGLAAYIYGRFVKMEYSKLMQFIFSFITIGIIAWSAYTYLPWDKKYEVAQATAVSQNGMTPADYPGWYVFSPELQKKLLSEGKTVFLDIGAAWCTNCKVNERKVLHTEDIMAEFKAKDVVLLKGDFTRQDPILKDWIQKGGSIGVPFNVLYIPGKDPIKMPELFTKNDIRKALSQIPPKENK